MSGDCRATDSISTENSHKHLRKSRLTLGPGIVHFPFIPVRCKHVKRICERLNPNDLSLFGGGRFEQAQWFGFHEVTCGFISAGPATAAYTTIFAPTAFAFELVGIAQGLKDL